MTLRRFFTERTNLRIGSSVQILDDEAKHIRFSVRMRVGDEIILFNGLKEYRAKLKVITREAVMAVIIAEHIPEVDQQIGNLTLFLSLIRPTNFELVVQKATEMGVSKIIPLATEYAQVKPIYISAARLQRWQKIALQACKQSERVDIPTITSPMDFAELESWPDYYDQFICLHPANRKQMKAKPISGLKFNSLQKTALMVGPEGGFSDFELAKLRDWKIVLAYLNPYILRSETAAIVGVGFIQAKLTA